MDGSGALVRRIVVLGGGSAGLLTALALRSRLHDVAVTVIRSKDIGIIGVGEGSTLPLYQFLHGYLGIRFKKFMEIAQPTWKLGLRFIWGPRPHFYYTFGPGLEIVVPEIGKPAGAFADGDMNYADPVSALMSHDRVFPRGPDGAPLYHAAISYHFENEKFVSFLEQFAVATGTTIVDDTVERVVQDEQGVRALALSSGRTIEADLFVDCSGFRSMLLGQTLGEPFISFTSTLFCDRAVVGGWDRTDEPVHPYTTCETMDAGWCWQIEHEHRINRGYVYSSDFIADGQAEAEFRRVAPKVGPTRIVRFRSGRYRRAWVKNVVGIGNASGFVEPLEATALGTIALQAQLLTGAVAEGGRQILASQVRQFNRYHERAWDSIRWFLGVHYKFNTRRDTEFWRACQAKAELGEAEPIVEHYRESGPGGLWERTLFDPNDQFKMAGYAALLVGQRVPCRSTCLSDRDRREWEKVCGRHRQTAINAMTIPEVLRVMRSPNFVWK